MVGFQGHRMTRVGHVTSEHKIRTRLMLSSFLQRRARTYNQEKISGNIVTGKKRKMNVN